MKMMKNWIALLLALCMMAALGVASACCTEPTGMEEPQTMEETCACMMDGKGVDGCECMDGMCGDKCACGEGCKCAEKRLDMLAAEMNALFEKNMELWNKLFGMLQCMVFDFRFASDNSNSGTWHIAENNICLRKKCFITLCRIPHFAGDILEL